MQPVLTVLKGSDARRRYPPSPSISLVLLYWIRKYFYREQQNILSLSAPSGRRLAFVAEWQCGKAAFSLLPSPGDASKAMLEEWQSYSYGTLPPSSARRCSEGAEVGSRYSLKKNVRYPFLRFVIPSAAEGSFSFPSSVFLRKAVCMKHRPS